ncbi:MAG TPA: AAA family ATPase [Nitrososphaerales archaeon]
MPTLDVVTPDTFFGMFKGEPGTRKSTAALSFPTPQYWFDVDQKIKAMLLPGKRWGINFKDVEFDRYTDWNSIRVKLEKLQVSCPYKTLIMDSITSIGDAVNRQTMKFKTGTTTKSGEEKGMRVAGIPVNTLEDYKAEASAFSEMLALLKDINQFHKTNVILIAHVIGDRNIPDSRTHFARIIVTGGKIISAKIPAYCEEVYHFNVEGAIDTSKEGSYGLKTVHTGDDFARTSLPLPASIVFNNEPLYERWIKPAMQQLKDEKPVTKF